MKTKFKTAISNNLIKTWKYREDKISPIGYEMQLDPNEEYLKAFIDYLYQIKEEVINSEYPGDLPKYKEFFAKRKEQFIKDCDGAKPKITIRVELEKYEEI